MESGKFDITYTKKVAEMDEQHSLKSYEKPRPEFKEAHVTMKALLLSKFGAFKFAQNMVSVSGRDIYATKKAKYVYLALNG